MPKNETFGFVRLTGKKCLYISQGHFNDGEMDQSWYWLLMSTISNKEKDEVISNEDSSITS